MLIADASEDLAREYDALMQLYDTQPAQTRHFLNQQAEGIITAFVQKKKTIHYQLPSRLILEGGVALELAATARQRTVGRLHRCAAQMTPRCK
jgi:hypothetical protein